METMLRLVNARNLALLIALTALASAVGAQRRAIADRYVAWRYPPQGRIGRLGREILDAAEKREKLRVESMHARVAGLLAKSREEGFDTASLEAVAARALNLNVKKSRPEAIALLNQLEMDIPRKKVQYIPMNPEDEKLDIPNDIASAPPKKHLPKRRSKVKRSQTPE